MKHYLAGAVLLLTSLSGWTIGGDRVGNGGDVLVCPGQKTELLDIFQGQTDWGFSPLNTAGTRDEIIREVLKDFIKVDPKIGNALKERALEIEKEISLLEKDPSYKSKLVKITKNELLNISDEGVAELPPGCKLVQAATQLTNPFPKEVKFTFQGQVLESLDVPVQSSLILHEVIYEHMLRSGEYSSRSTRYLNAALHAGQLATVKDYFEVSSLFEFRNIDIKLDGPVRMFGASKKCSVTRETKTISDNIQQITTVIVNRRNVIMNETSFDQAMNTFWKKYVSNGMCD